MKKILFIISLCLLSALPVSAATDDFTATANITVENVAFGDTSVDMLILNDSTAESWTYDSGAFTVTNPGAFMVACASSTAATIMAMQGNTNVACALNTTPGTSYLTLPTAAGTYTIAPSTAANCNSLCASVSNAATYNAYPTCGAATCNSGYSLSGSGSSATCALTPASGGGSSSVPTNTADTTSANNGETKTQTLSTSGDGAKVTSETTTTKTAGAVTEEKITTTIELPADPTVGQTAALDTQKTSDIKNVEVILSADLLKTISTAYGADKNLLVEIISKEADPIQKTDSARGGLYLVGFDTFKIDLKVGGENLTSLPKPITLEFDITKIKDRTGLKLYFFNETKNKWELAGDGGLIVGDKIMAVLDHLTTFALLREITNVSMKEVLSDSAMHWQQIMSDASTIVKSGDDANIILNHSKKAKDEKLLKETFEKYTKKIIAGSAMEQNKINALNYFIAYGTKSSAYLGAGERAGVLNSYKYAFGQAPADEGAWTDCLAIANGRWPTKSNQLAIKRAETEFKKIYKRPAVINNKNDNSAITILAYGLRNLKRNTNSESFAIKTFRNIYKTTPLNPFQWDIVRAVAYSGAKRGS
jgi:hypothetical protein